MNPNDLHNSTYDVKTACAVTSNPTPPSPPPPPPPMDDETVSDPLSCPSLRWGLIGCGKISHDFTQALKVLPTQSVVACAARRIDDAKLFAEKHGIPKSYGNYDDLIADNDVDVVYVANIHPYRRQLGEKSLLANKNVLLEKPFTCNAADAEYLIGLAQERKLFLMEGMWTRFFPAVEKARRIVFGNKSEKEGMIGEVVTVTSDFHYNAADNKEEYPTAHAYNPKLGGGVSYYVAPYPLAAATLFFHGAAPDEIKAAGLIDKNTGVDLQVAVVLAFPPTGDVIPALDATTAEDTPKLPGCGVATLSCGMLGESAEETTVVGTKGRLKIGSPGHCPTNLTFTMKGSGRGGEAQRIEYEFPLPYETDAIKNTGGYFFPNSAGLAYEAAAVARCIAAGKLETPQYTLHETLNNMRMIDEIRKQIGVEAVVFPGAL